MAEDNKGSGSTVPKKTIIVPNRQQTGDSVERVQGGVIYETADTLPPPPPLSPDSDKK